MPALGVGKSRRKDSRVVMMWAFLLPLFGENLSWVHYWTTTTTGGGGGGGIFWTNTITIDAFQIPHKLHRGMGYDVRSSAISAIAGKGNNNAKSADKPSSSSIKSPFVTAARNKGKKTADMMISNKKGPVNKDIFHLRKGRNGAKLAEERLQLAIAEVKADADLVQILLEEHGRNTGNKKHKKLQMYPDERSFNMVLNANAKEAAKNPNAAERSITLLNQMLDLAEQFPHLNPSTFTYNTVLESFSKGCNSSDASRRRHCRLKALELYNAVKNNPKLEPDTYTYNLVLASLPLSAEEWKQSELWALKYLENPQSDHPIPDRNTYNQLLECYAAHGDFDSAEKLVECIVQATQTEPGINDLRPSPVWFNLVLKALMKQSEDKTNFAGDRAERILERMIELKIYPVTSTYNQVLNIYSGLGETERSEALVDHLETRLDTGSEQVVSQAMPDAITYSTLIKAYSVKQKLIPNMLTRMSLEMAQNATQVFEKMERLVGNGQYHLAPTRVTYNTLISIWANVGTREALNNAAILFQKMCEDPQNQPDSFTYTTLIHAWSRGVRHSARTPEAGNRAEQLLHQLEQLPSNAKRNGFSPTMVYNSAMTAWSKSGEAIAADKVDALFERLERKYLAGEVNAQPNKTTFLCMLGAYAKARVPDAEQRCEALLQKMKFFREEMQIANLEPDRSVYNAVLNAIAKSHQSSSVAKVEEVLSMMQTAKDERLKPDIITYATLIDCHTKCGGDPERAEEILRFVLDKYRGGDKTVEPNAVFYSAVLQAWAKTATPLGARKAEGLLRRNIELYEEGHEYAKPHAIMYNAVMDAIARSGESTSGPRAEELLNEMEALYHEGRDELRATQRSYNAVILAYRNAGGSGRKAEELLERMEVLSESGRPELTPDVVSYNCVISAIVEEGGSTKDDDSVADRAQSVLDRMEQRRIRPDGRTYSSVIEAWLRRNDEKGHALAEMMLQQFVEKVDSEKKKRKPGVDHNLYEDAVWDVINAYRKKK